MGGAEAHDTVGEHVVGGLRVCVCMGVCMCVKVCVGECICECMCLCRVCMCVRLCVGASVHVCMGMSVRVCVTVSVQQSVGVCRRGAEEERQARGLQRQAPANRCRHTIWQSHRLALAALQGIPAHSLGEGSDATQGSINQAICA